MRREYSLLRAIFALLLALPGCAPYLPAKPTEEPVQVKIACRDAPDVRQSVLMLLRFGRGKDINVSSDGSFLDITVAFTPTETPVARLAQLLEDLNHTNGVIDVAITKNPRPILQNF